MEYKPLKLNKRGVIGLDMVKSVIISLMVLAVLAVAAVLALVSLRDTSLFTASSLEYNQTSNLISNVTTGTTSFFTHTSTIFTILGAVVIILVVAVIIAVVSRFGGAARTGSV